MAEDFIDGNLGSVFLELEKSFPDVGFEEACLAEVRVRLARVA